ncbi:MAG: hypothetical protein CME70_15910 [Halobacteriovorax sp.]|nr:hypothetical protein [Halobacteriovorax sp.]
MKTVSVFLLLFCISSAANASRWWSDESRDHLLTLNTTFSNPFASTMIGVCKAKKIKYKDIDGAVVQHKRVRVDTMNSGRLPSVFVLQNENGVPKKAPLMFVLPGAFTTTKSEQPIRMAELFYKKGYHVVTLPNPWGVEFVGERPFFTMGSFVKEGEAIYMAMRSAYERLSSLNFLEDEISVMGISGGGYITAMVAGMDSISGAPILTGYATSIAAPMIWSETIVYLDKLMTDVKERLNTSLVKIAPIFWKICKKENQSEYDSKLFENAKFLTIYGGFHKHMIKSIELFDELNNLNSVPKKGYKKWRKNMNFSNFYRKYNPRGLSLIKSKWGRIDTWVNLAKENGYNKTRIVSSLDDFLNVPEVFNRLDLEEERLYLIPFGGHWGIRGFGAWFDRFFDLSFDSK